MDNKPLSIQMTDFNVNSFESLASMPEIRVEATFRLVKMRPVIFVDTEGIKQCLTEAVRDNVIQGVKYEPKK